MSGRAMFVAPCTGKLQSANVHQSDPDGLAASQASRLEGSRSALSQQIDVKYERRRRRTDSNSSQGLQKRRSDEAKRSLIPGPRRIQIGRSSPRNRSPKIPAPLKFRSRKTIGEWLSQIRYWSAAYRRSAFRSMTFLGPRALSVHADDLHSDGFAIKLFAHSIGRKSRSVHTAIAIV
jgi:hypothetical protein